MCHSVFIYFTVCHKCDKCHNLNLKIFRQLHARYFFLPTWLFDRCVIVYVCHYACHCVCTIVCVSVCVIVCVCMCHYIYEEFYIYLYIFKYIMIYIVIYRYKFNFIFLLTVYLRMCLSIIICRSRLMYMCVCMYPCT